MTTINNNSFIITINKNYNSRNKEGSQNKLDIKPHSKNSRSASPAKPEQRNEGKEQKKGKEQELRFFKQLNPSSSTIPGEEKKVAKYQSPYKSIQVKKFVQTSSRFGN
mmetsp:Transcript_40417/g.38910  ORF Transcript_40417/g.38910 Transcript_40417/m.38910 type:complete len:108 (-) Transcript_40417:740-1063(-)